MILLALEEYRAIIVLHVLASLVSAVHEMETGCRYLQVASAWIRRLTTIF
jgi:hypothetical protein